MSDNARLLGIKNAPISWKERDLLTAAERYMSGAIDFPLISFVSVCFPRVNKKISQKIQQVWTCSIAAYHLQQLVDTNKNLHKTNFPHALLLKAARIYEQEAQRILGALFSIEDKFWETFYIRQQEEMTKPLVATDALHFLTQRKEKIAYQLLIQSLKSIIEGYYSTVEQRKNHYENAKRLILDLPMDEFKVWLQKQKSI